MNFRLSYYNKRFSTETYMFTNAVFISPER